MLTTVLNWDVSAQTQLDTPLTDTYIDFTGVTPD